MSLYRSDGDIYAGWSSVGRWLALVGGVAGLVSAGSYMLLHGYLAPTLAASDQVVAFAAQWIGGGLAAIMAVAVFGSISISRKERGDVEVSAEGVRRIFSPAHEEFFTRGEIAGLVPRPMGGVELTNHDGTRTMVIPRSLDGYRDCIAEMKALGVERLPAKVAAAHRWRSSAEWACTMAMLLCFEFTLNPNTVLSHRVAGILLVGIVAGRVALDWRMKRTGPLGAWLMMLAAIGWVAYKWVWAW